MLKEKLNKQANKKKQQPLIIDFTPHQGCLRANI